MHFYLYFFLHVCVCVMFAYVCMMSVHVCDYGRTHMRHMYGGQRGVSRISP